MIGNGQRSSSATAYLAPQFLNRTNLHVLINAHVTKLLETGNGSAVPAFRALEFVEYQGGKLPC